MFEARRTGGSVSAVDLPTAAGLSVVRYVGLRSRAQPNTLPDLGHLRPERIVAFSDVIGFRTGVLLFAHRRRF